MPAGKIGVQFMRKVDGASNDELLNMLKILCSEAVCRCLNYVDMAEGEEAAAADGLVFASKAYAVMSDSMYGNRSVAHAKSDLTEMVTYA